MLADLRFALRALSRQPGHAVVAVLTLALAIGAATAIYSAADAILFRPLPYPAPERLVRIWGTGNGLLRANVNPLDALDWRREAASFEELAVFHVGHVSLTGKGEPAHLLAPRVTAGFFPLLGAGPLLGRLFRAADEGPGSHRVVVLGHGLWVRRFGGDPEVVGERVLLDGEPYEVVGVLPRGFEHPAWDKAGPADLWRPLALDPARTGRGGHFVDVFARLEPGVSVAAAQAEMDALTSRLAALHPETNPGWGAFVEPFRAAGVGEERRALLLLLAAVGVLLLVAALNVACMALSRGWRRGEELAVRAALGAPPGRLARLAVAESLVTAAAGGGLGLLLAWWLLGALTAVGAGGGEVPRLEHATLDLRVLAAGVAITALAALVAAAGPALRSSRRGRGGALARGRFTSGPGAQRGERALLVVELGLSLALLVGAGLLVASLWRLGEVDPGFRAERLLTFGLDLPESRYPDDANRRTFFAALEERLTGLPGIERVGFVSHLPLSGTHSCDGFTPEGGALSGEPEQCAESRSVAGDYFAAIGLEILEGRAFDARDGAGGPPAVVVNRALAEVHWPGRSALGRRLKWGDADSPDPWRRVVGVVEDVRHHDLETPPVPEVYSPHAQLAYGEMSAVARTTGEPGVALPVARRVVWALDPELPLHRPAPMADLVASSTASRRLRTWVLAFLAGAAALLAAVGVYGVTADAVGGRRREIGIRIALGASPAAVRRQILGGSAKLLFPGLLFGGLGAWWLARALAPLLFGISPASPPVLFAAAGLLAACLLVASWAPARRATRVDPIESLRQE